MEKNDGVEDFYLSIETEVFTSFSKKNIMEKKTTILNLTEEEFVHSGNRACSGCGLSIIYRIGLKALGKKTILVVPPSCLTVLQGLYPVASTKLPCVNVTFASTGAAATGVRGAMKALKKEGLITPIPFDDKIEWTYFFLWHHEGRRARMGAAMMGPDYTQWHGNFEVAERFYMELVPEVQELIDEGKKHGKTAEAKRVYNLLDDILNSEMHKWFLGKTDPEEVARRKAAASEFRKRYSE